MTVTVTLAVRRLALFGPPLALGVLSFAHPLALTTRDLAPQADWFITLHVLQVVLFGLIGLGVYLLIEGLRGPLAVTSRAGLAVFVVFLGAWDAMAGMATGILVRDAARLPADQQPVAFAMSEALFSDPLVGGASIGAFSALGGLGAIVGFVGAALALRRAGAPRVATLLLGLAGLTFWSGHLPTMPLSMTFLVASTAMLEIRAARPTVTASVARPLATTSHQGATRS
jgi:hypothetical protein